MFTEVVARISTSKHRIQRLGVEGAWIVVGQAATVAGSLALVRILTDYLSPQQYGELALALTLSSLVNQVFTGGLAVSIGRFYSIAEHRADLHHYLRASWICMKGVTLALLCLAISISIFMGLLGAWPWIALAMTSLLFATVAGFNGALSSIQNAARQRAVVALHASGDAWLKMAFAMLLMWMFGISGTTVLAAYALSAFCIQGSQLFFLRRLADQHKQRVQTDTSAQWRREIRAFALPVSSFGIFTWAQQNSDRWALEAFTTTAELGRYAVVFQMGYTPIAGASGLLLTLVAPVAYQRARTGSDASARKHARSMLYRIAIGTIGLTLLATAGAAIFHAWLFTMLAGVEFRSASHLLPWVVMAGGLFAAAQILSVQSFVELDSRSLLLPKIVTAVLGVGCNIAGARCFGPDGVVAGLVVFSLVYLVWMMTLVRRTHTAPPPMADLG
jgi:O-antigen/teichoic acid export membrane protein